MAQENVDLVRRLFDAWNDGELEEVVPFVAEGIEWLEVEGRPESAPGAELRGRGVVRSMLEQLFDTWQAYRLEPKEVRELEDGRVLAIVREVARGRASGATVASEWGYLMTVGDDKLVRVEAYRDPGEAVSAGEAG